MADNKKYVKYVDDYAKQLENLSNQEVVVGIPASKNEKHISNGEIITLAQLGAIHEYGAPKVGIPQRSFLRAPLSANVNKLFKQIDKDLKLPNLNPKTALGKLGANGQSIVLQAFKTQNNSTWDELKPATIRSRKKGKGTGEDMPLIDSGQLRRSITFEVRNVTKSK